MQASSREMHQRRIRLELIDAGVTRYGLRKFSLRYLHNLIDKDEHIKAAIYGRYADESGTITLNAGALIATNKRIIFIDHKPGYTRSDDIDYAVVSGVRETIAIFSSVSLFGPLKNYTLNFVNKKCAAKFKSYVEKRIDKD